MNRVSFALVASKIFLAIFLIVTLCEIFISNIWMPETGLDPSWVYAMNQFVAQKFIFGKDVIFTYGPYASVSTHQFHPDIISLYLIGGLYLAFCYFIAIWFLMTGADLSWRIIFCIALAVINRSDAIFLTYPLIASLLVFRCAVFEKEFSALKISAPFEMLLIGVVFSAFGILPLIKGSFLVLCLPAAFLSFVMLWRSKKFCSAFICLIAPVISMIIFWTISGQNISDLSSYFLNMGQIIFGYTEAMAVRGKIANIVFFIISTSMILGFIGLKKSISIFAKIILLTLFSATLFIGSKSGFLRHDAHAKNAGDLQMICALLLGFVFQFRLQLLVNFKRLKIALLPIISLVAWLVINKNYSEISLQSLLQKLLNQKSVYNDMKSLIFDRDNLVKSFDDSVSKIRSNANFPILEGGSDIYSIDQALLIASGNQWAPRPIFQSYSAYTEKLANFNANHLLSEKAPKNIFFKLYTVDNRFFALDDGVSWPILLNFYEPYDFVGEFVILKRSLGERQIKKEEIFSKKANFAEDIKLDSEDVLFAEIEVKPTMFGRILSIISKPEQLWININLSDGSVRKQRVISSMMKSGFVISPLVETTSDFVLLYGDRKYLKDKVIKSFSISDRRGKKSYFWKENYHVKISKINAKYAKIGK